MTDPTADLPSLRVQIDALDDDLLLALSRRRAVVARMRQLKAERGHARLDPAREESVRARWHDAAVRLEIPAALATELLDAILRDSRARVSE